jgi:DNA polymerase
MTAAPGADEWVPKPTSLKRLRDAVQDCRGCELWEGTTRAVLGEGPRAAELVLVGEQPGDREDLEGNPFVGPAGRLLGKALEEAGIDPRSTYRTNAVKHFRFDQRGKRRIHQSPAARHVTACRPWLVAELSLLRPTGVVLLGATAVASVWGSGTRLGDRRGTFDDWPDEPPLRHPPDWVTATTHPSAVLRSRQRDADFDRFVADLSAASDRLRSPGAHVR